MRRRPTAHLRRAGWFLADTIVAIIIVGVLAAVLVLSVRRQQKAADQLADSREATRLAERTLIAMQTGAKPPPSPAGMSVKVRSIDSTASPARGCAWAVVTVTRPNGRASELTGLVRRDAIPAGGGR